MRAKTIRPAVVVPALGSSHATFNLLQRIDHAVTPLLELRQTLRAAIRADLDRAREEAAADAIWCGDSMISLGPDGEALAVEPWDPQVSPQLLGERLESRRRAPEPSAEDFFR